jgi:hypothetical protein
MKRLFLVSILSTLALGGCAAMAKQQQEDDARAAQRAAAIREARAACYSAKRDDLAGVVYDAVVGRRYKVTTAVRGNVVTEWLEGDVIRSKIEAKVEEGRTEGCKAVTIVAAAESLDTASGEWMPSVEASTTLEDDLYIDIHAKSASFTPVAAAAPN